MTQLAKSGFDAALGVLADVQRRRLLVALLEHNPQEDTVRVPDDVRVDDTELERLQRELYHRHLPQLEDAGFVRWRRDDHEFVRGPKFDEIRPLLELVHRHRDELPEGWV